MTKKERDILQAYRRLRNKIDIRCEQLHREHIKHTQCHKGCSSCCMDFRLLPVEFFYILEQIKNNQVKINRDHETGECVFLVNDACSIYEHRPVICRSHGLPILYTDEEFNNLTLAFCPLNFREVSDEYFTFENSYDQDMFNQRLFKINSSFVRFFKNGSYTETQMIEISRLADFL